MRPWVVWLAWALWSMVALGEVALVVFARLNGHPLDATFDADVFSSFVAFQGMATVGLLIVRRDARNAVGWILLVSPMMMNVANGAGRYAQYALTRHPGLPGGLVMSVPGNLWPPGALLFLGYVALLFPDGRLPSPRWRPLAAIGTIAYVAIVVGTITSPGPLDKPLEAYDNPIGVEMPRLFGLLALPFLALLVGGVVAPVVRYRRGSPSVREQLKWFVAAVVATAVLLALMLAIQALTGVSMPAWAVLGALWLIPAAVGIAILRYRLYDIDVVIRKTLVYGALTVVLGTVYLVGVVVLGGAVRSLTGQSNALVVTLSTLGVAALFRPLLRRIQALVDRRFYRGRYDSTRALQAFAGRLREEVDLREVEHAVHGVLDATVQPASASLWLRDRTGRHS